MRYLSNRQIEELWSMLVEGGVGFEALFASVDKHLVASLPRSNVPREQLWIALNEVASMGRIEDGTAPIVDVLNAACALTRYRGLGPRILGLLTKVRDKLPSDCRALHEELGDFDALSRRREP